MNRARVKWVAAGNEAVGFLAFGNLATGFIAIGNFARGFIAIGNVAVGVVALGNVGVGIVAGGGATIGIGMIAVAGVLAFPVLEGAAGVVATTDAHALLGVLPIALWFALHRMVRGDRPVAAERPALVDPQRLLSGELRDGWVQGKVGRPGEASMTLATHAAALTIELAEPARGSALELAGRSALARLVVEERVVGTASYREAPPTERVLIAQELREVPRRPLPWASAAFLQWYLSWAWLLGAGLGAGLWMAKLLLA